jgi:hypothetical protein
MSSRQPNADSPVPSIGPVLADAPAPAVEAHPPTHEEIALRAYFLWNASHDSDPLENWLTAEQELRAERTQNGEGATVQRPATVEDGTGLAVGTAASA